MKTRVGFVAGVLLSTLNLQLTTTFAQGTLTPPGPPAPTMKSLDQIEARTPIASATFTITKPGSYYLTTNLFVGSGADGIDIRTNGVTLDLNGFTIFASTNSSPYGAPYSGIGLFTDTLDDITIRNGHLVGNVTNNAGAFSGNGFAYGIIYYGFITPSPVNFRVSGVTVSGCLYHGIYVGLASSGLVESCNVQNVGGNGIYAANVSHCMALQCGSTAIYASVVSSSVGSAFGSADGIYAVYNAQNCQASSSGSGYGLYTSEAENCSGTSASGYGLYANSAALNSSGTSTSGVGIYTTAAENCYGNCTSSSSSGISATTAQNCYGYSYTGDGIYGATLLDCYGYSGYSYGIYAWATAIGCYGASGSGTGLYANVGNSCYGNTESVTYKYNMP